MSGFTNTAAGHGSFGKPKPAGTKGVFQSTGEIPPPLFDYSYLTFRGYGTSRKDGFSVLCGDDPPTIMGGYAKWKVIDRPLRTGVTVFQGYDPVTMKLSLRFGAWDNKGWYVDETTGRWVESQIEKLEWMAGAHFGAGQSPYVYVNSYGPQGNTTNLIPYEYQTTVAAPKGENDTNLWPWIMSDGIEWGKSYRARGFGTQDDDHKGGSRVYQECTITLTSFQGLTKPSVSQQRGSWFKVVKGRDNCLLIAEWPPYHALDVQQLAQSIQQDKHNNPLPGSKIQLKDHHLRWQIPVGKSVFVPEHTV